MKKAFALSALLATASAGLGAYGYSALEEIMDEANCAANKWECSTQIPRTISDRMDQYGDEERARLKAIIGPETYDGFNTCDSMIAIHMQLAVARTRVVAEFANQFPMRDDSPAAVQWTPPSADDLFANFKDVADNKKVGFFCGGVADPDYFADGQESKYDQVIEKFVQGAKFDYMH